MAILVPVTHLLEYSDFVVNVLKYCMDTICSSFPNCLSYYRSLHFPINFEGQLVNFYPKKSNWEFHIEIKLNL